MTREITGRPERSLSDPIGNGQAASKSSSTEPSGKRAERCPGSGLALTILTVFPFRGLFCRVVGEQAADFRLEILLDDFRGIVRRQLRLGFAERLQDGAAALQIPMVGIRRAIVPIKSVA